MLAPDDRAVLRELLRPAHGDTVDYAVATTFTMDLTAALVAPLAFAAFQIDTVGDPVAVLESVRSAAERVDIFCQVGQIRVPASASDLMAFLEPMVHEVAASNTGYLFHPKVWIVRYEGRAGSSYRLVCGTRNLTDDTSWDAVISLDGFRNGKRPRASNRPIVDLLRSLPNLCVRSPDDRRKERINKLADEISSVEWSAPEGAREVSFHTLGLDGPGSRRSITQSLQGRRHLIVSPFLDDAGIRAIADLSDDVTVVSRIEALEKLEPALLKRIDCKVISPLAGLVQPDEEQSTANAGQPDLLGGLHAKIYGVDSGRQGTLIVGSPNATNAGMNSGNVEFAIELRGGYSKLGTQQLLGPDAPFAELLEDYAPTGGQPESPEEELSRELERELRRLCDQDFVATVAPSDGRWTETVTATKDTELGDGRMLTVGLLGLEGRSVPQDRGAISAEFDRLATADITPFVILELQATVGSESISRSSVVRADLQGDPDGRLDEVLARQVDTPEKFLRFVALLLGLSDGTAMDINAEAAGDVAVWSFGGAASSGVFELLVQAVSDKPQAIPDLDRLVDRLSRTERGRSAMPEGFLGLWATIREAHELVHG